MEDSEPLENDGSGGIIFHRGYLIQGENQTVEGGLTLVFPVSITEDKTIYI